MSYLMPVSGGKITSYFGVRNAPIIGASTNHKGIDISVPVGTPVMAALDGIITTSSYNSASGNYIVIDHGNGLETVYKHLSEFAHSGSRTVTQGEVIGLSGNTGLSTGAHLHFEILKDKVHVDPLNFSLGKSTDSFLGFDSANVIDIVKKYWYAIAGAMVVLAVIKK